MIQDIEIPFAVGDVVWRKNLFTNESIQTTVKQFTAMISSDGSKCIMYFTGDNTTAINVVGRPSAGSLFATKEECDAFPRYVPPKQ